jgi:hypothetical protein
MRISVLGVDLGKNVCSVVGLDAFGRGRFAAARQARGTPEPLNPIGTYVPIFSSSFVGKAISGRRARDQWETGRAV